MLQFPKPKKLPAEPQPAGNAPPRSAIFPLDGLMTVCEQGPVNMVATLDGKDSSSRGVGKKLYTPSYPGGVEYTGRYDGELLAREITQSGYKTVGMVCPAGMYHGIVDTVKSQAKGVKFVDATDLVDLIKVVKSAEELEMIRATATMQDDVMKKVASHVKPGMKDFEVAAFAQYHGQLLGSEQGIFLCSSAPPGKPARFMPRAQQAHRLRSGSSTSYKVEHQRAEAPAVACCRIQGLVFLQAEERLQNLHN